MSSDVSIGLIEEERLLGKDIQFTDDFKVGPHGDYKLLVGEEALRQAIYNRLMTKPGEFKVRPEYGVGVELFVKKKKTTTNINELKSRIIDQLSLESRIEEIEELVVKATSTTITINLRILASGKALKFRPFTFTEVTEVVNGST